MSQSQTTNEEYLYMHGKTAIPKGYTLVNNLTFPYAPGTTIGTKYVVRPDRTIAGIMLVEAMGKNTWYFAIPHPKSDTKLIDQCQRDFEEFYGCASANAPGKPMASFIMYQLIELIPQKEKELRGNK